MDFSALLVQSLEFVVVDVAFIQGYVELAFNFCGGSLRVV